MIRSAKPEYSLDVLLIGYEDQTNLGLRSILAVLKEHGYQAKLAPYTVENKEVILETIQQNNPRLIGFSIIFQYTLDDFAELMSFLRDSGITQHFTAGGHFPSLRPSEVLHAVPFLDTIVRFEGELTILELLNRLDHPNAWSNILGLAFRRGNKVICTPARPLIQDLDSLPMIEHGQPSIVGRNVKTVSMLASRGCLFECSFCSIRQFYGGAPGPLRRVRTPRMVVEEMQFLYDNDEARYFVFQDDDFAARTKSQRLWLSAYLDALAQSGLVGNIAWKISCRVDDLDQKMIDNCRKHGLLAVYLGVESGSPTGLRTLNKHVTIEQNLQAIELLKANHLVFSIGFMLFDPSTTFDTIRENITFLRKVSSDGSFPMNFCKMLPYAGTPIEEELKKQGRLIGTLTRPDYEFTDQRVGIYAYLVQRIFSRRNFDPMGLVNRFSLAQMSQSLGIALGNVARSREEGDRLCSIIARSNTVGLDVLEELLDVIQSVRETEQILLDLATREWESEVACIADLDELLLMSDPDLLAYFGSRTLTS
jgi:anaerobic magnesium-protoporphyrin IX monomethyl ester cyclase